MSHRCPECGKSYHTVNGHAPACSQPPPYTSAVANDLHSVNWHGRC